MIFRHSSWCHSKLHLHNSAEFDGSGFWQSWRLMIAEVSQNLLGHGSEVISHARKSTC